MMKLDDIIGDIVFIALRDVERYASIGLKDNLGHFKIQGFDHYGLWVSHPGLMLYIKEDESGVPYPPDKIQKEELKANFIITWDNILTIMHYPDRKGFDFPNEFDRNIGFSLK